MSSWVRRQAIKRRSRSVIELDGRESDASDAPLGGEDEMSPAAGPSGSTARPSPRAPRRGRSSTVDRRALQRSMVKGAVSRVLRRQFLFSFLPYLTLLVLFTYVTWRKTSANYHFMDASIRELLLDEEFSVSAAPNLKKNFADVRSIGEFWDWVDGPLLKGLSTDKWYDGAARPEDNIGYLSHTNKLLGPMRWRQLRVKAEDCQLQDLGDVTFSKLCYPPWSNTRAEDRPFGGPNGNAFNFSANVETVNVQSTYSNHRYGEIGYVVDVPLPRSRDSINATADALRALKENNFIDLQTRAIIISLNVLNQNVQIFGSVFLVVEFLASGDVGVDSSYIRLFAVESFNDFNEVTILVAEALLLVVVILLFLREFGEMRRQARHDEEDDDVVLEENAMLRRDASAADRAEAGLSSSEADLAALSRRREAQRRREQHIKQKSWIKRWFQGFNKFYFLSIWNYVEVTNLVFFLVQFSFRISYLARPERTKYIYNGGFDDENEYVPLEVLAQLIYNADWAAGVNFALTGLTFFQYLRLNDQLHLMWAVISTAARQLAVLVMTLVVFILAFAFAGILVFGKAIKDFRNLPTALTTCMQMMIGHFDYEPMSRVNRYLAAAFFWGYIILSHLILLNLFIAGLNVAYEIVYDAHQRKAAEREKSPDSYADYGLTEGLKSIFRTVFCIQSEAQAIFRQSDASSGSVVQLDEARILQVMRRKNVLRFEGDVLVDEIVNGLQEYQLAESGEEEMEMQDMRDANRDRVDSDGRLASAKEARYQATTPASKQSPAPQRAQQSAPTVVVTPPADADVRSGAGESRLGSDLAPDKVADRLERLLALLEQKLDDSGTSWAPAG